MIKELVIISGKGGTGKTSLTAALAHLAIDKVICDTDVDAADMHLLMDPTHRERHAFSGGGVAVINKRECEKCDLCREMCRFGAIDPHYRVDSMACEGCGVCVEFCPVHAIVLRTKTCGEWFISETRFGPLVHARLGIAEDNSGKLVTTVRKAAQDLARKMGKHLILTDGPPGVGCPVIASLGGATAALIVTEPTVSGLHDMQRVAELTRHFKVPGLFCTNKYDLNPEMTGVMESKAVSSGLQLMGRIPFDPEFTHAMVAGQTLLEFDGQGPAAQALHNIWEECADVLDI